MTSSDRDAATYGARRRQREVRRLPRGEAELGPIPRRRLFFVGGTVVGTCASVEWLSFFLTGFVVASIASGVCFGLSFGDGGDVEPLLDDAVNRRRPCSTLATTTTVVEVTTRTVATVTSPGEEAT